MKECCGLWLPDHELHLVEHLGNTKHMVDGKPTYQHNKLEEALRWVKRRVVAVDVGAHVGLWSRIFVKSFPIVHAFEPSAENRACFEMNVQGAYLHPVALGATRGKVSLITEEGSSGDTCIVGSGQLNMRTLDEYGMGEIDLLKVDCVGYELNVLRGAEQTLIATRPAVVVEQKPGYPERFGLPARGAVEYLQSLGARLRAEMSGVYMFSWEDA